MGAKGKQANGGKLFIPTKGSKIKKAIYHFQQAGSSIDQQIDFTVDLRCCHCFTRVSFSRVCIKRGQWESKQPVATSYSFVPRAR